MEVDDIQTEEEDVLDDEALLNEAILETETSPFDMENYFDTVVSVILCMRCQILNVHSLFLIWVVI